MRVNNGDKGGALLIPSLRFLFQMIPTLVRNADQCMDFYAVGLGPPGLG